MFFLQKNRFKPSKKALDYLIRFETIVMPSLTLDVEWVPELFEVRAAINIMKLLIDTIQRRLRLREIGEMLIGVTRMPKTWTFSAYHHLEVNIIAK